MKTIGLIAGIGRLPVEFARAARGMGVAVVAVGVVPQVDEDLAATATQYEQIPVGELERVIGYLKQHGAEQVTMLGKVTKEVLFSGAVRPDARAMRLLAALPNQNDDTILLALVKEFMGEGLGILDQTALIKPLMPGPGVLTRRQPSAMEKEDMDYGFRMAKAIGGLDIGQTVVVKNKAIMAVEAIEGTDACIRRGGALGRGGVTVAKTAKPSQDMRFDVPSVGPDTLQAMLDAGATALVIEAHKTLLVEKETVLRMADEHGIAIAVQVEA